MQETPSAPGDAPSSTAVVIPLRSLRSGKLRLQSRLDEAARAALITDMANTVISAAHELPVFVVHDDEDVAPWAVERGAVPLRGTHPGLNRAVSEGVAHAGASGHTKAIVAHADLPHAQDLRPVADFHGITLVPDRLRDGTNVLCVPTDITFPFSYGPGSFAVHLQLANETGRAVRVLEDPALAWDVDHPDDLITEQEAPA